MDHDVGLDGSWLEERCEMSGKPSALAGSARRPGVGIRDCDPACANYRSGYYVLFSDILRLRRAGKFVAGTLQEISESRQFFNTTLLLFGLALSKLGDVAGEWSD
ncbi:hypothetical protein V2G26_000942 [Clonostachys chloroleuca]